MAYATIIARFGKAEGGSFSLQQSKLQLESSANREALLEFMSKGVSLSAACTYN